MEWEVKKEEREEIEPRRHPGEMVFELHRAPQRDLHYATTGGVNKDAKTRRKDFMPGGLDAGHKGLSFECEGVALCSLWLCGL